MPFSKEQYEARTRYWFQRALEKAEGFVRLKIEKQLKALGLVGHRALNSSERKKLLAARGKEITVVANSKEGFILGQVPKNCLILLQYVSGKWKGWGGLATENPDNPVQEQGDRCQLVISSFDGRTGTLKRLYLVPTKTVEKPSAYLVSGNQRRVVLHINDNDGEWAKNPGKVKYRIAIVPIRK